MVRQRAAEYRAWFAEPAHRRFDVFHAQDGISANALADMRDDGLIPGFAHTVHHIDDFADPAVAALQARSITAASRHFVVSRMWRDVLAAEWGVEADLVGNGVDLQRFTPGAAAQDGAGPVFLSVGGVEARKNSLGILAAFRLLHARQPDARLVIAGGASLLDHGGYQARFAEALAQSGLPAQAVQRLGPVSDAVLPALYARADALVFPSLREGFGLVVLEAMACGLPCIVADRAPFTEYLARGDALWCDPEHPGTIAAAMAEALRPDTRQALIARGLAVAARHAWASTAQAHLPGYAAMKVREHA
jgi:glycosyltransferase-like protein